MPPNFTKRIDDRILKLIEDNIKQGAIGKIQAFDSDKMRADVDILLQTQLNDEQEKKDFGVLPDIPVNFLYAGGYYIKPPYEKGDLVWVSFSSHDIDKALEGVKIVDSDGVFNFAAACVVHGVAPSDFSATTKFKKDGLVLGKDDESYMRIDGDTIEINGDQDFVTAFNDMKDAFDTLKQDLNNFITIYNPHTHISGAPGVATGPPSAPGSSSSADMSAAKVDKVKVP